MGRPNINKIIHDANKRGLFVMVSGKGDGLKYEFWDRKTGKLALVYYPPRKSWVMPGAADRSGDADDYHSALSQAFDAQTSGS